MSGAAIPVGKRGEACRSASRDRIAIITAALIAIIAGETGHAQAHRAFRSSRARRRHSAGSRRSRRAERHAARLWQYAIRWAAAAFGRADAPEKYMAANDLSRVYDLENGRFQMRERRNMLFPFLAPFGHSFALNDNRLDGDVAFDINGERAQRQPQFSTGVDHGRRPHAPHVDDEQPVVLVRAMLDPATKLSAPKQAGRRRDRRHLKQGDKLTAAFTSRHAGVGALVAPHTNLARRRSPRTSVAGPTRRSDDAARLSDALDWRNVDFFKLYRGRLRGRQQDSDLAAPAAVRSAAEPPSYPCSR
jgi:hypothetical protein